MVVVHVVSFLLMVHVTCCANDGLTVITKLPRSPLLKYHSYFSVMILHFDVPHDVTKAVFKFKARDDTTSFLASSCDPRNVSLYMKAGAYPVINPDGVPLPKSFLNISRPILYELILKTDSSLKTITVESPVAGDWFAVAFLSWTDPKKERIEQQGLTARCEAHLYSELAVNIQESVVIIAPNEGDIKVILLQNTKRVYKYYVPENIDHVLITLEVLTPCKNCANITIMVQTGVVPNALEYQEKLVIHGRQEDKYSIRVWPEETNWHYITFIFDESIMKNKLTKDYLEFSVSLKYLSGLREVTYRNESAGQVNLFKTSLSKHLTVKDGAILYNIPYKQYTLMRLTAPDNFIFEYDFRAEENGSTPVLLNVTSGEMTVLKFSVYKVIDIGGTLTVGLAIKPEVKIKKELRRNYTVIACIRRNAREIPVYPNLCYYNNTSDKSPLILNSTNTGSLEFLHIPFPDPGTYFLSLRVFDTKCDPCNCSEECVTLFRTCMEECEVNCTSECGSCTEECRSQVTLYDDCEACDCDGTCARQSNETEMYNASLVFSISSNPCIAGRCGQHGKCNHYMAGGFIFSSCQCSGGYRGWDCSDSSQVLTNNEILIAILLLTLSNLLFIPSIYFAYKRNYYTEAAAYFCSMFASTFYHACDSKENQYGFCLFPIQVLQFCDFYCALLTIWVTLVAMAYTNNRIISLCHMVGAVILAFGVTYNKHALWVYLLPTISGIIIIGVSWGLQCRQSRKLFPARKYLKLYMPFGAFLVIMGLVSFAFLETKENYKIVHSLWHVVMALSLIFLLPNKKTFIPKN